MDQLLSTKFFIPPTRPNLVQRPHLIKRLDGGLHHKLSLISAPAGFGKTTLLTEWLQGLRRDAEAEDHPNFWIAWISLDEGDNDPARFLTYFIAALNRAERIQTAVGEGALTMLQSPQAPPVEIVLTPLINEIAAIPNRIILVLDDYHVLQSPKVDDTLTFLLENLPPQLHLVIATREDPNLPLSSLRARDQLTELRARELRFSPSEAGEFLTQVMELHLSPEDIAALETRTEGWIAGLQLAAITLQGQADTSRLVQSFTGSNRLVLDYLVEEVLEQQPENIQAFLLQTAILERMNYSLCAAVTGQEDSQQILAYLESANLFIVPLDNERRWYRYHHLFADLLKQRLHQSTGMPPGDNAAEYHVRASEWYENQDLVIEAFQHAAAANDIERAGRLIDGGGVPLQYRGAAGLVRNWLERLPAAELDARPSLWVTYASALNLTGEPGDAEIKLQAAESAQADAEPDDDTKNIVGHIAAIRAMMAVGQQQLEPIITHSRRALEYLQPDNLAVRTITNWTLGYAYQLQGDRTAASRAYNEVLSTSRASGDIVSTLAATTGLGNIQESENQLYLAAESYRQGQKLFGAPPQPIAVGTYLGLARILYEWNDLDAAQQQGDLSLQLAQQLEILDTYTLCGVLLARIKLARGDVAGAAEYLSRADQFMRQHNFMHRLPEVVAAQVRLYLQRGDVAEAAQLVEQHDIPISQARVHLALGETSEALAVLEPLCLHAESEDLKDERLKVLVLQAVAHYEAALRADGEKEKAVKLLDEALTMAEPGGFVRTFVDEGPSMRRLLHELLSRTEAPYRRIAPDTIHRLLGAFPGAETEKPYQAQETGLIEPLSEREIEVLHHIAEGLTNKEIAAMLYLSPHTVKVHAHNIYAKLGVNNRTQAVARGKALGILSLA